MVIRKEQFTVFGQALRQSFLQSVAEHLRRDFPADLSRHGIADGQVEPLVRRGALKAETYGITAESHLRLYLECLAILGPDFDTGNPAVHEILTRQDAGAGEKMSELNEYLIFGLEEPR